MVGINDFLVGLQKIPMESLLNIGLLLIVFTLLYMNPYKPKFRDMLNWWKLKLYKNPSIHRIIFPNGDEKEYILSNFDDKIDKNYDKSEMRTYIMNQKLQTRRNKVPIFTHHLGKAQGVDFFNDKEAAKLDGKKLNNLLHKSMISVELIKQLLNKKDLIKYIAIIAIGAGAAALFSFQGLNAINELVVALQNGDIAVKCANAAVLN